MKRNFKLLMSAVLLAVFASHANAQSTNSSSAWGTAGDANSKAVAAEQFQCCPKGVTCRRVMPPCPSGQVCAAVMPAPWAQCKHPDTPVCCPDYTTCTRNARSGVSTPLTPCSAMYPKSVAFSCCPANDKACLAGGTQPCSTLKTCCKAGETCPSSVPRCNVLGCCPANAKCTSAIAGATLPTCYAQPHNPNECCPAGSVCPPDASGRVPRPCTGTIEHDNPSALPKNVTFQCTEPPMDPAVIADAKAKGLPMPLTECEKLKKSPNNIIYIDVNGMVVGTTDAQSSINNPDWQMIIGNGFVPDYPGNSDAGKADTPSGLIFDEYPQPQRAFENLPSGAGRVNLPVRGREGSRSNNSN